MARKGTNTTTMWVVQLLDRVVPGRRICLFQKDQYLMENACILFRNNLSEFISGWLWQGFTSRSRRLSEYKKNLFTFP